MWNALTIGTLARRASVGVETIRFYERRGLVPRRPARGFRAYPEETVARIRFIRQAQALGFTLKEIAGLLALRVAPGTDCASVRERAAAKLEDVEARLAELARIRRALEKLLAACPGRGAVASCTILGAISEEEPEKSTGPAARRRRVIGRKK
jgi:MerR family mercuric resistance operon transcriptional regulator